MEELRAFPIAEEEKQAYFGDERADQGDKEGMPDQRLTEEEEEVVVEAWEMGVNRYSS